MKGLQPPVYATILELIKLILTGIIKATIANFALNVKIPKERSFGMLRE